MIGFALQALRNAAGLALVLLVADALGAPTASWSPGYRLLGVCLAGALYAVEELVLARRARGGEPR